MAGGLDKVKADLRQIAQEAKSTAGELDGLGGRLSRTTGTANQVGSGIGKDLAASLSEAIKTTKAASSALSDLARKADQTASSLP